MNMFSKRLVIIMTLSLSVVLCRAGSPVPVMPTVATAVQDTATQQVMAPVTTAQASLRAKAMDKLRGLWSFCKRYPETLFLTILTMLVAHGVTRAQFSWMALVCLGALQREFRKELNLGTMKDKQVA